MQLPLTIAHEVMLHHGSGLTEDTIAARGYRTVSGDDGAELLTELGFSGVQARRAREGDVLLVPLYNIAGQVVGHQIRPDVPRVRHNSPIKYESPAKHGNRLDIPPSGRERVADGKSPLWITEGAKTADALAQAGCAVMMLAGVWGFMGRRELESGTAVISALYDVPVEGRTVYLAYDSDVTTKEPVRQAEKRLAEVLRARGAEVRVVRIPAAEDGSKQGADDYLVSGGSLEALTAAADAPEALHGALGTQSPHVYAYNLLQAGHEIALDLGRAFLRRPIDANSNPAGPARRYDRAELRDKLISLAGQDGMTTLEQSIATHAVSRLAGDHGDKPVQLAPDRLVRTDGATWIDTGAEIGADVICVSASGWGYAPWSDVPYWIVRHGDIDMLTAPAEPGARTWAPLWDVLSLDVETCAVIRVWLVALLVSDRVPLLWWRGAASAGKSTRARMVGRLLGLPDLVPGPRDVQDAVSKLQSSPWLMAENLGALKPEISDLWCAAVTDGTLSDRILYTSRQAVTRGRWTGQVTSVRDVGGALDDLMTRALVIDVPIPAKLRDAGQLLRDFEVSIPAVRGALFDDAVACRQALADGWLSESGGYRFPAVLACARVLDALAGDGSTTHADAVMDAGRAGIAERADADPWVRWLAAETRQRGGEWSATAAELLDVQREQRRTYSGDWRTDADRWPATEQQVGNWLPARAGRLREHGIEWSKGRRSAGRRPHVLRVIDHSENGDGNDDGSAESGQVVIGAVMPVTCDDDGYDGYDNLSPQPIGDENNKKGDTHKREYAPIERVAEKPSSVVTSSSTPVDLRFCDDNPDDDPGDGAKAVIVAESAPGTDLRLHSPVYAVDRAGTIAEHTLAAARDRLCELAERGPLTVDVETTGYPLGHPDYALRTVQLGTATEAYVFDVRDDPAACAAVRDVLEAARTLHAHAATADLVPLAAAGLIDAEQGWQRLVDTGVLARLAGPGVTGNAEGLKALSAHLLGALATTPEADKARSALFKAHRWSTNTTATTTLGKSGWAQVDPADPVMVTYAASDVLDTAALALGLPVPDAGVLDRERAVQRITARISHHDRGMRLDPGRVGELLTTHATARDQAAQRCAELGVPKPNGARETAAKLTELGAELPTTANGNPSATASVLGELRDAGGPAAELAAALLDYRGHAKLVSGFLAPFNVQCVRGDGRVRPTVHALGTDTGRMACVRPNLQQIPREGGIRGCLTADPGQLIVSADFSGVELRVAAALSQDSHLCRALAEGRDLHGEIARQVWGAEATKAHRYIAKRGVFGRLYGGGVPTLARQMGVTLEIAQAMVDTLDAMMPELSAWSRSVRDAVKAGFTRFPTYAGRVIHLPGDYPHKAVNYAIQGTARELLVDALLEWPRTLWGDATILPIHDEIIVFVPEDDAEHATQALVDVMTRELYGVQIAAEASAPSYAWSDSV